MLNAERWAAVVAAHDGVEYPREQLETAWKQVLFNQFHDILPGSAIEPSYDDARDQLGEAVSISKRIVTSRPQRPRPPGAGRPRGRHAAGPRLQPAPLAGVGGCGLPVRRAARGRARGRRGRRAGRVPELAVDRDDG
ncbi:hypothetical protein ACRAWC_22605 [Leifsonia sp. L25]|uniref:hypothetical protein n=1 Tax=Leifsonia sp. L25 TaxID=3423957 RepID=UPI003D68C81A